MKQVALNPLKSFLFDIVSFTDEQDENGKPIRRTSYHRDHLKAIVQFKRLIRENSEVAICKTEDLEKIRKGELKGEKAEKAIRWVEAGKDKLEKGEQYVGERFTDRPIELTDPALEAIKYYYKLRETLLEYSEEVLEEFDKLIA